MTTHVRDPDKITVFQEGRGTTCGWRTENGEWRGRIERVGRGRHLDGTFDSVEAAEADCQRRLRDDPGLVFLLLRDDELVGIVLDEAWHAARERRAGIVRGVVSILVFAGLAWGLSVELLALASPWAHAAVVGGVVAIHCLLLWIFGMGNIEAVVWMIMLLLLIAVAVGSISRLLAQPGLPSIP